ncbi:ABC-F family ATP-binding cassette domain-containing protein [Desulfoluna spongiiphila]|uniref:ATP-binding cassette, subfamily F, uup n=1 Tax=Desulfoluna spongiiphila TaxID=419481 RepID=A0A1G5J8Z7_9BACT|nr:ABC-F family ATP-binding cassette domain-containing protein [Desulfoluna spongiiphila]SCY84697.1 ATP-binding cassette, subfamily F, uup [Desulfoluna spongiiphila]VVS91017.1 consensus disorder prediction [Desulfoluna spongiiphila]
MSLIAQYRGLGKSYGARTLFTDISMNIHEGDRIGLIGVNGAGKSTLLKVFAEVIQPDAGEVVIKKGFRAVYLPQESHFEEGKTVSGLIDETLDAFCADDTEAFGKAWQLIGQVEFPDLSAPIETLSGGWKKRLAVVLALIKMPDLLFLDEPTNHLDLSGILWLESVLKRAEFAYIMITHDRALLSNVTGITVELGEQYPGGYLKIDGNYGEFLRRRDELLSSQAKQESALASVMRREKEWLARSPKARTTKAQFRIDNAKRMEEDLADVRTRNRSNREMDLDFTSTQRKTRQLVVAKGLARHLEDRTLFEELSFVLSPGTCLGLVGNNGTGKSTLMRQLCGKETPDKGLVREAEGLRIVHFEQERDSLDLEMPLRKALSPDSDSVIYRGRPLHVVTWAKKFLFTPDQLDLPLGRLSGGEKARVLLAHLMRQPADVLLLDEPTNDLDIPSLEMLEESLQEFQGAVVLASHDRYLMETITSSMLGFLDKGGVFACSSVDQWGRENRPEPVKKKAAPAKQARQESKAKKKFTYKHKYELEQIEAKIIEVEEEAARHEARVNDPAIASDPAALQEACGALGDAQKEVEALYSRWEALEELKAADEADA